MAEPSHNGVDRAPGDANVRVSDTSRVEAFSDGVFAIVITLLVLDLRLPEHRPGELFHALLAEWSAYVAFLVSFAYVGVLWVNHHALFHRVRHMDSGLLWINVAILLSAVIVPFPAAVLGDALAEGSRHDERVAVVFYALAAAAMAAPWWWVFTYLSRHLYLLEPGVSDTYLTTQRVRPLTGLGLYVVCGVGGWFVGPALGLVCIVVVIVYHALTSEGLREGPLGPLLRPRRR
ncbi:TMEM175 family protein [Streptomyces fuscigenes]|uniref:TMEM175 family protein n=1 Tax=Streptomyces fuscigenes TaxID=1528880 RepID=UPI001F3D7FFC|nr:TMEM175 family protein [Streptomyces fuscigenes]MCF3965465.1 DUF1211 domain-containing protein [Streptomyces fuscigenes]